MGAINELAYIPLFTLYTRVSLFESQFSYEHISIVIKVSQTWNGIAEKIDRKLPRPEVDVFINVYKHIVQIVLNCQIAVLT